MSYRRSIWRVGNVLALGCAITLVLILAGRRRQPAPPRQATGPYSHVIVFVVGNTNYQSSSLGPLHYAEDDARDVAAELSKHFGFQVTSLIGTQATKANILLEFHKLVSELNSNDDFIFYFSGHGATQNKVTARTGYLVPFGTTLVSSPSDDDLDSQAVNARALADELVNSKGRHRIMILDSCFSGYAASDGKIRNISLDSGLANLFDQPSVQMLTAGTAADSPERATTFELPKVAHGVFTYALLKILSREQSKPVMSLFMDLYAEMQGFASDLNDFFPPQLRLLSANGDFSFVPLSLQGNWSLPLATPGAHKGIVPAPVTGVEFLKDFARLEANEPLNSTNIDLYKKRFSLGDAAAGVILTEVYGRQGDEKSKQRALDIAQLASETETGQDGVDYGALALSLCYENGWGITNKETAKSFRGQSGLNWFLNAVVAQTKANAPVVRPPLPTPDTATESPLPPVWVNLMNIMPGDKALESVATGDLLVFIPRNATIPVDLYEGANTSESPTNLAGTLVFGLPYKVVNQSHDKRDLQIQQFCKNPPNPAWIHDWTNGACLAALMPEKGPGFSLNEPLPTAPEPALPDGSGSVKGPSAGTNVIFHQPVQPSPVASASASNLPPVALVSASQTNGAAPLVVSFSSAGSYSPRGGALTYNWNFGDTASSTAANPSHTYTAGTFNPQLTISDGTSTTITKLPTITATNPAVNTPVDTAPPAPPTGLHVISAQ